MSFDEFLRCTEIIDFDDERVSAKARELGEGYASDVEIAKRCFEFVRDEIHHTNDYKDDITTCRLAKCLRTARVGVMPRAIY